jgi:hypothetical protein
LQIDWERPFKIGGGCFIMAKEGIELRVISVGHCLSYLLNHKILKVLFKRLEIYQIRVGSGGILKDNHLEVALLHGDVLATLDDIVKNSDFNLL